MVWASPQTKTSYTMDDKTAVLLTSAKKKELYKIFQAFLVFTLCPLNVLSRMHLHG